MLGVMAPRAMPARSSTITGVIKKGAAAGEGSGAPGGFGGGSAPGGGRKESFTQVALEEKKRREIEEVPTSTSVSAESTVADNGLTATERALQAKRRQPKVRVTTPVSIDPSTGQRQIPLTEEQILEGRFVLGLGLVFVVILLQGLVVAASGFLPDDLDHWAQTSVLPAFTPTVGIFLFFSTIYGAWKSQSDKRNNN